ncbi:ABC transporter ATP-binding protein [Hydrogenophaga sp. BPS33]|uniref:ABC transporter ATP-binding protein n=1 Tax=Hydrogenophaga sp. BPS33 TaxID=2651974 RepID=UPI00135A5D2B|nr:ATP-binding cassette domain-containing protein [Hydrogenophaga sp. BPS33]
MMIDARHIVHRYSGVLAVDGVSLTIEKGSFCALLGPNGAGKSTLAQILSGVLWPTSGSLLYEGVTSTKASARGRSLVRSGICLVPEGRRLFGQLTIEENLVLGGYGAGFGRSRIKARLDEVVEILPTRLRDGMRTRQAGMLSGGERQMLALARALMADPQMLLIDEPSMGLAPILIEKVYEVLTALNQQGVTVMVIEQQATHAIRFAQSIHVLERGKISYAGPADGAAVAEALRSGYVGTAID